MRCDFRRTAPGELTCSRCGRVHQTNVKPRIVYAPCRTSIEYDIGGPHDGSLCVHRGEPDGTADCGCGGGKVTVPAYLCDLHGRCTNREAVKTAWCRWCDDFHAIRNFMERRPVTSVQARSSADFQIPSDRADKVAQLIG